MAVVRYVLVKLQPGVDIYAFEKFEREVDYVKAAQNPSIVGRAAKGCPARTAMTKSSS